MVKTTKVASKKVWSKYVENCENCIKNWSLQGLFWGV